ncbi:MAG: hypothetical protein ABI599_06430 [Flavobacteriales bacterium]
MKRASQIFLSLAFVACTPTQHKEAVPSSAGRAQGSRSAQPVIPATALIRSWIAKGITFNGVADPNFKEDQRVEFLVHSDGTYRMSSASTSTDGTWRMEGDDVLLLMDTQVGGAQRFGVDSLSSDFLALRLLDEVKAEVVLLYRAE